MSRSADRPDTEGSENGGGSGISGPFFLVMRNRRKERAGQAKLRGVVIREVFYKDGRRKRQGE